LLGGSVAVESEVGKGSKFSVTIPSRYGGETQ
jgi:signal transduction histidine kinase